MREKLFNPSLLLAVVLLFSVVPSLHARYTVTDLGVLNNVSGSADATIDCVNLAGKAVGITASNASYVSFIYGGGRTNLGTLGGTECEAQGINNSDIICGKSFTPSGDTHAFRWTPGGAGGVTGNSQMSDLGTLGGHYSEAQDINASGQIAGTATTDPSDGTFHACRFNPDGTITDIGALNPGGLPQSFAYGINAAGQVVGTTYNNNFKASEAFLYDNTNLVLLGDLTGPNGHGPSGAFAINSDSQVVGYAVNGTGQYHAFSWRTNRMVDLGTLGGTFSEARSINSSDVIVGDSTLAGDTVQHACIASNNVMVDLNGILDTSSNGWVLEQAEYINDNGIIVGYGTKNGVLHGFLLTAANAAGSAPVITNQPSSVSVVVGGNATFSVVAGGTAPLAYQWHFNTDTILSGATNSSLTITNLQVANAGNYTVVITNDFGSITSSPAVLTLNFPPSITNQPVSQSVLVGGSATFNVTAGGTAPLAYQWKFTSNLAGQTNSSLTIANTRPANTGNYSVIITNNFGSVTSAPAYLNVVPLPQFAGISVVNTNVLLGFNTSVGATYYVETRTNLAVGNWVGLFTNIAGSGGIKSVTDTNGARLPTRFYRIHVTVP